MSTLCIIRNMSTHARRAIGIIRVSQPHGREGESFSSPKDQRAAIERLCAEHDWCLLNAHPEMKISGDALLADRPGLSQAVAAVLSGSADIIVADTTERLWWNHEVRAQVLRLVQDAGGEVWSADQGCLSNGGAAEEFSGTVRTAADRFSRQQNAEKSRRAVVRAVERGVVPWPGAVPGYVRLEDGRLQPHPKTASVVAEAFRMRDDGDTIKAVRAHLWAHGIERSQHGVMSLLASRMVLGEIHFGDLVNLHAHEAIVDIDVWRRVQKIRTPRGRKPKSDHLLARQGVLRCGTCGARMSICTQRQQGRIYPFYRCPPNSDCPNRMAISAQIAETEIVEKVRHALANVEGRASAEHRARDLEAGLAQAQADLDAAFRAFAGFEDETAARDRLAELRVTRDRAQDQVDELGGTRVKVSVDVAVEWDRLSLDERRGMIRATVKRAIVSPGRGATRIAIELFDE